MLRRKRLLNSPAPAMLNSFEMTLLVEECFAPGMSVPDVAHMHEVLIRGLVGGGGVCKRRPLQSDLQYESPAP